MKAQRAERNKRIEFDPSLCPTDTNGRLYVRLLSGYAFALNAKGTRFYLSERRDPITSPANPNAPEGCLENPLHVDGFGSWGSLPDAENFAAKLDKLGVRRNGFLRIKRSPKGKDSPWDQLQQVYLRRCEQYNWPKTFEYGLQACLVPDKDYPESAWSVSYMALPDRYATPMGQPFYAECFSPISRAGPRADCSYGYLLQPGMVLTVWDYNEKRIPARHLIEFDRLLREAVEKARFPQLDFTIEVPDEALTNEQ